MWRGAREIGDGDSKSASVLDREQEAEIEMEGCKSTAPVSDRATQLAWHTHTHTPSHSQSVHAPPRDVSLIWPIVKLTRSRPLLFFCAADGVGSGLFKSG